jgi:hypothetical protein
MCQRKNDAVASLALSVGIMKTMQHRHLTTTAWTLDAIDSCLERGDLPDWRELFGAARGNKQLAQDIITIASKRDHGGASVLARELALRLWPELARSDSLR